MIPSSRILIVDDEPFNVDYLEQELEDFGYAAASAGTVKKPWTKLRPRRLTSSCWTS
jgi:CheY-like chemotaxis protein